MASRKSPSSVLRASSFDRHRFVVKRVAVPARRFRCGTARGRPSSAVARIAAVLRRHRDADAGADLDRWPGSRNGSAIELARSGRQIDRRRRADRRTPAWMIANSSPPSRASTSVSRSADFRRLRHLPKQRVAGGMAERIVDVLETIEIEHQDRKRLAVPAARPRIADRSNCSRKNARFGSPVRMSVCASSSTRRLASASWRELRLARPR